MCGCVVVYDMWLCGSVDEYGVRCVSGVCWSMVCVFDGIVV